MCGVCGARARTLESDNDEDFGCVCAGFKNKCTRKLRVNYGVNDAGPFLT